MFGLGGGMEYSLTLTETDDISTGMFMVYGSQIYTIQGTFQFISCTGPGQAVQYTYRLYEAKRDCTPNELSPSSEIYVN